MMSHSYPVLHGHLYTGLKYCQHANLAPISVKCLPKAKAICSWKSIPNKVKKEFDFIYFCRACLIIGVSW